MLVDFRQPDTAASVATQFARDILNASQAAFYEVDDDFNLNAFVLCGVPPGFHRGYIDGMRLIDPLHPRYAADRAVAWLKDGVSQGLVVETVAFQSFSSRFGISEMGEFFFRRGNKIVAGMSVAWAGSCKVSNDTLEMAQKIHDYLEFNLVTSRAVGANDVPRYRLTARETDVAKLLCCGRTNREIGDCLSISLATVKTHLIHIFEKLGVETRSAAVAMMARLN
jgi:DNA-binding CsgD family transcriptional regulator